MHAEINGLSSIEDLVRQFLRLYGAKELRSLLVGESRFTSENNPGFPPADIDAKLKRELVALWSGALYHLEYAEKSGVWEGPPLVIGKHVYGGDKQAFQSWLSAGAPGTFEPELLYAVSAHGEP